MPVADEVEHLYQVRPILPKVEGTFLHPNSKKLLNFDQLPKYEMKEDGNVVYRQGPTTTKTGGNEK